MNLELIDVAPLNVATELPDLRRDLHVFVDYVRAREVKRSHRENALSKADAKRLARLMSDPDAVREVFRLLQESAALAPTGAPRFSADEMCRSLELIIRYSAQQGLIPRAFDVDELFDDVTRKLF